MRPKSCNNLIELRLNCHVEENFHNNFWLTPTNTTINKHKRAGRRKGTASLKLFCVCGCICENVYACMHLCLQKCWQTFFWPSVFDSLWISQRVYCVHCVHVEMISLAQTTYEIISTNKLQPNTFNASHAPSSTINCNNSSKTKNVINKNWN